MKMPQRLAAIFAAAIILSSNFPVLAAETNQIPEETTLSEPEIKPEEVTEFPVPDEAPPFHAHIEFRMGCYTVIGTFTDFTPDITLIETLYSLDGENWKICAGGDWKLYQMGIDNESMLKGLQNQPCLFNAHEPLKSYIAGEIDRFYLKLRITKKNGLSYETQFAAIERSGIQPIPEGTDRRARFSSTIAVNELVQTGLYPYRTYGRYQLTIPADATAQEISALLPDTLPVEIQLDNGADFIAIGVVDCPVKWKPLSLPRLSSGETITIPDAAEEIVVPAGTQISTPLGIFQLDESLSLDTLPSTDEVRLVLNVSPEEKNPIGVLKEDRDGLKIALHKKATGATSIQAYVLTEGESKWTELSGLSLMKELNDQPSTENSGYGLVLRKDQDPYQSYLAAEAAGETPTPFFIGLKINGGIYDGKQLILPWPDTYEQLSDLPEVRGAEGNEGNAGAGNRDDSTESGQRPNLSQTPDNNREEQPTVPASDDSMQKPLVVPAYALEANSETSENRIAPSAIGSVSDPSQLTLGQRPNPSQTVPDTADTSAGNQEDSRNVDPLGAQVAADIKNEEKVSALPNGEAVIGNARGNDGLGSFLPAAVATTIATGSCIGGAAICIGKAKGYSLFCRIAGKIRTILHR